MNIADLLERAARPTLIVPASERLTAWPQGGTLSPVRPPAAVLVRAGDVPPWERARQLLEPDEPTGP